MIVEFENKCSKLRQQAILKAIWIAKDTLMPRVRKPILINIVTIRKLADKKGVYGDCMDEGDREFTIRVDVSLPLDEMVTTILHEMVHVKQYIRREVMDYSLPYDQRPHEIEAHTKEKLLKEIYDEHGRN